MMELLGHGPNLFDAICMAQDSPDNSPVYGKPSPKFIVEMIEKFDFLKEHCHLAGDKINDVLAGINAQVNAVLIATNEDAKIFFLESPENKSIKISNHFCNFQIGCLRKKRPCLQKQKSEKRNACSPQQCDAVF
jgi:histidinol phosphatase-like enzyme